MRGSLRPAAFIPGEPVAVSNAHLVAELQTLAVCIRMFGLAGLANMSAKCVQETPENEQVRA